MLFSKKECNFIQILSNFNVAVAGTIKKTLKSKQWISCVTKQQGEEHVCIRSPAMTLFIMHTEIRKEPYPHIFKFTFTNFINLFIIYTVKEPQLQVKLNKKTLKTQHVMHDHCCKPIVDILFTPWNENRSTNMLMKLWSEKTGYSWVVFLAVLTSLTLDRFKVCTNTTISSRFSERNQRLVRRISYLLSCWQNICIPLRQYFLIR